MHRFCFLLAFVAASLVTRPSHGQPAAGQTVVTFPFYAARLLADPARARVYAAVPATGSVAVIDTTTLQTVATVPVGTDPEDMAISPDGGTLYVTDAAPAAPAIDLVDLATLTTRPGLALPGVPLAVAAGRDGRVYAAVTNRGNTAIDQLDAATGTVQTTFNPNNDDGVFLQTSPDGGTLYATGYMTYAAAPPGPLAAPTPGARPAAADAYPAVVQSFDVSTAAPVALLDNPDAGNIARQLVLSHDGRLLAVPCAGGNSGGPDDDATTYLFAASDLTSHLAALDDPYIPGFLAFSPDDAFVYQHGLGFLVDVIQVFDVATSAQTATWTLPPFGPEDANYHATGLVVDGSGSYLFVNLASNVGADAAGDVAVFTTGRGTLPPPAVAPVVTSGLNAYGTVGTAFTYQITASYLPTGFTATGLPGGLGLDAATGLISGTPTAAGTFPVGLGAVNAAGPGTAPLSLTIRPPTPPAPVITSATTADGTVGTPFAYQITATNSPTGFSAGTLPGGLGLDAATGLISGTPTTAGTTFVTFYATNDGGFDDATLDLTIGPAPGLVPVIAATPAPPAGIVGQPYFYAVVATSSPTGYSALFLPPGLGIDPASGVIAGTPTAADEYDVDVRATNAHGTGSRVFRLNIAAGPTAPPVIGSPAVAAGRVGVPFVFLVTASNAPTFFDASPLPPGLGIDPGSGLISGTPTTAGTFALMVGAVNSAGFAQAALTLTFAPAPVPAVTSPATARAATGQVFTYQIAATNGPTGFDAANLPPGLGVDPSTGLVSGTPTTAGTFNVTLRATNANGTGMAALGLTVVPGLPVIDLLATVPRVAAGSGGFAAVTINRTGDLSQKLNVFYSIKGSARNGTDYVLLTGKQKIRAHKASATIQIVPKGTASGNAPRVVKITVSPDVAYQPGSVTRAKIKILPGE